MTRMPKGPQNGPPADLVSHINHLGSLLQNLPTSLPLDPPKSSYSFGLTAEQVEDEGIWYSFNRNLEVCFETHRIAQKGTITFRECDQRYESLIKMFKIAVKALTKDADREFLCEAWLEHLINAAKLQGAKILTK
jgi:hypothetical protein